MVRRPKLIAWLAICALIIAACAPAAAPSGSPAQSPAAPVDETPAAPEAETPAAAGEPTIRITSPTEGATVQGPLVRIEAQVDNFELVDANIAPQPGEGHLHFFVNQPADAVPVGDVIPLERDEFVHVGAPPFTWREIELPPGEHTITVVMGDAVHRALNTPAPQSVTFRVE